LPAERRAGAAPVSFSPRNAEQVKAVHSRGAVHQRCAWYGFLIRTIKWNFQIILAHAAPPTKIPGHKWSLVRYLMVAAGWGLARQSLTKRLLIDSRF
jgi:hypothetical protein